ncbi:hypothetical protein [Bradyrhizobium guangdongense]|uniref:Uncharacterized protein n=1 Tax=Bradyrhizobium guangdongense TaxID=1325090 RepID=A0AA87W301_9BRAD|nr:hypothetical protein [Bradyrhizobium guangdongense]GGI23698.1 hypothetical protein GCM10010987_25700 [Bradyrhizobium guangdongense]
MKVSEWSRKAHAQGDNVEIEELWAKIANDCLERTGDEGRAIREANAVIARQVKDGGYRPE